MSEERRQVHPQEPAEGSEEDVEAPGAEKAGEDRGTADGTSAEERSYEHPQEPAEGGEDEVEAPGAEKSGSGGS